MTDRRTRLPAPDSSANYRRPGLLLIAATLGAVVVLAGLAATGLGRLTDLAGATSSDGTPEQPAEAASPGDPLDGPAAPPDAEDDPDRAGDDPDRLVTGRLDGFLVPEGEIWEIDGAVTTDANVEVRGVLRMRPGSSLTFTDVDESAFVGGGMDVLDSDVGLWVMGAGQLDVQGSPVTGWNRTGDDPTWSEDDEYVIAPHEAPRRTNAEPWEPGDEVPCTSVAGQDHCAEVANLTRDVTIQGTETGKAHIFIRSERPQTIRYAELRHLGPSIDTSEPDGRYGLHFHHAGDGSRGSVVEGTVARDMDDHAYSPHESHGITFHDTVAYDVKETAYWWDPDDHSDDILYERALAMEVHEGGRDSPSGSLAGFRLGKGEGNRVADSVAAAVWGAGGYLWRDGSPNEWVFENNTAHHASAGIFFWTNEHRNPGKVHQLDGFVAYRNSRGIEHGAYQNQVQFRGPLVMFDNSHESVGQRAAPRTTDSRHVPGTIYRDGVLGGGYETPHVIDISARRNCEGGIEGQHTLYEDLWLVEFEGPPIRIDQAQDECRHDGDRMHVVFRNVVLGPERRELERDDFEVVHLPADALIEVERTDGSTLEVEH